MGCRRYANYKYKKNNFFLEDKNLVYNLKRKICKRCGKKNTYVTNSTACPYCGYFISKDNNDGFYAQIIKSFWTHEPWEYFKVVVKDKSVMGDYICLHGFVPQNELPFNLRNKIPENEIWIESGIDKTKDLTAILVHELAERLSMKLLKIDYDEAHEEIADPSEESVRDFSK